MSSYTTSTINRSYDDTVVSVRELVRAFDADAMMGLSDNPAVDEIAGDARDRLGATFAALDGSQ